MAKKKQSRYLLLAITTCFCIYYFNPGGIMSIMNTFFDFPIELYTPKDFHPHTPEEMLKHKEMKDMDEKRLRDLERAIHEDPKSLRNHVYIDEDGRHDNVFADRNESRKC
jgi:hypothetical protein